MNFLAHAQHCLDAPYELAGVALPDWLSVIRPRLRCRSRHAAPFLDDDDVFISALACGVVRHHWDDRWFHQSRAFVELSLDFARQIRAVTADSDGMRPSFVGHILVELLLDAELTVRNPAAIDEYYFAVEAVDPQRVAEIVEKMTGCDASGLTAVIARFLDLRFLYDYVDDQRLCYRLNQVMHRVRLPVLPADFAMLLPSARREVCRMADELTRSEAAGDDLAAVESAECR